MGSEMGFGEGIMGFPPEAYFGRAMLRSWLKVSLSRSGNERFKSERTPGVFKPGTGSRVPCLSY